MLKLHHLRLFAMIVSLALCESLFAQNVIRGPYLQMLDEDGLIVRWRTDLATSSVVRFGADSAQLDQMVSVEGTRTEHSVQLTGLDSATHYFYSIGDQAQTLAGDDSFHFKTAPAVGTAAPTRIWVIGDSGTANSNAWAVRDAFKAWSQSNPANFMIMLGDNAYNNGTDVEYQAAVFDGYPELLRQLPVWSTLGNHDGYSADSATQSGPYFDIFDLPAAGEVGGLPSGTEAYYSFDHGNVHFICLDSYDTDRSANGNMMQWLESDLASNNKPWVVAFWHHPPYTKGSHDSDSEGRLVDMRQNALPILEAWGVDLVLSGHSHSYERSYLIDGHYGNSLSLDPVAQVLDPGDGDVTGDGAYEKPQLIAAEHQGAVYAVAGSSGKVSGGSLDHPAMVVSLNSLGSMVLDVNGNQLDAVFIDEGGSALDQFTILKSPDVEPPMISDVRAEDGNHVIVEYSERVEETSATDLIHYAISGLSISSAVLVPGAKSVRLTTSLMSSGSSYVLSVEGVTDEAGIPIAPGSQFEFQFLQQQTLSFQDGLAPEPGYAGTSDSYIREASPTTNYGSAPSLQVDGDEPSGAGTDMSILVQWDISMVPESAVVDSVQIHLSTLNVGGPYSCYGLSRSWTENETTWNAADASNSWASPGANGASDRDAVPLCNFNAGSTGPITIALNSAGLSWVQAWVNNPAGNHGILIADTVSNNGADFDSSESSTAMNRPKIELSFTVPANPPPTPNPMTWEQLPELDPAWPDDNVVVMTATAASDADGGIEYFFDCMGAATGSSYLGCEDSGWQSSRTFSDWYLDAGAVVNYRVRARDGLGNQTDWSSIATITVPNSSAPAAPTQLEATTYSSDQINLVWADNSLDEDQFRLERAATGSGSWTEVAVVGANVTSYSDSALAPATGYDYRVFAANVQGDSEPSGVASAHTFALVRKIEFSGRSWTVKSSGTPVGPGPNYFGDTAEDVWVDENGHLHLRVSFRDGVWRSSEVITDEVLGYGTYQFALASRVDQFDVNTVVGLFTWDTSAPEFNYREIDIEFSRWGNPANDNSQYVVQPWDTVGNTYRWNTVLGGNESIHQFTWNPDSVEFSSYEGNPPGALIQSWAYSGAHVPPAGTSSGNARINFWLMGGAAPLNGLDTELVITSFDFTPAPENLLPNANFGVACSQLGCNFTDQSTDSDGVVEAWLWDFGDGSTSSDQNPSHTYAESGDYLVSLLVTDNDGAQDSQSKNISVTEPPPWVDVLAIAEQFGAGNVSGSYADTHADADGMIQSITERESGGKKQNRYSYLSHTWVFELPESEIATFHANTWRGPAGEDQFVYLFSANNAQFTEMFTVDATAEDAVFSWQLPSGVSGPVYIRVEDTDQTPGNRFRETVYIDQLYVRAETAPTDPPASPAGLTAVATSSERIDLAWSDQSTNESGFLVERSGDGLVFTEIGSSAADTATYSDQGLEAETPYWYRVRAWNTAGESVPSNVDAATTFSLPPAPEAPTDLSATAAGMDRITLSWQDNSSSESGFRIERSLGGGSFAEIAQTNADVSGFTDVGLASATIYDYRVAAFSVSGDSPYSNVDSASTDSAPSIVLNLGGGKNKGKHYIDLSWSGPTGERVDVYRDADAPFTVPNNGGYRDQTNNKGTRTYQYRVCAEGTQACSAIEIFAF